MVGFRSSMASADERLKVHSSPHLLIGWLIAFVIFCLFLAPRSAVGAELPDCETLLRTGEYEKCAQLTGEAIKNGRYGEEWRVLKTQAELIQGRYSAASETLTAALKRYSWSIQLRLLAHDLAKLTGKDEDAQRELQEINRLAENTPWRYTGATDLVALGEAALLIGADPRDVLEGFFEKARKQNPNAREVYLAIAQLALDKHDEAYAGELYQEAAKKFPQDADVQFGLAITLTGVNPERSRKSLLRTLELNPAHLGALLWQVELAIDSENYTLAKKRIDEVLKVNPTHPVGWAFQSVLHTLNEKHAEAKTARDKALTHWKTNPEVDHIIGRKLSQKYRFTLGAKHQQQALKFDEQYTPALVQLTQDYLRLGKETEGWATADAAHKIDEYDVATFNLLELKDRLAKFRTIENEHFIVRMEAGEADIYGDRVMDLLNRAKQKLCTKYDLKLTDKIIVEIFADQNDFAVRTFGMPAVSGYLGVCFGKVITANSPASQLEHPANWEAVLWHEFCHVVTLHLTNNKMPRWLSEGISVYEELQENPAWGQRIDPRYREMILGGELTPIGKLSSAFLDPKSGLHVQFAYYESALVVEYITKTYGLDALKNILRDLGAGVPINEALERHTTFLPKLEQDFLTFAKQRAKSLAPKADWKRPDLAALVNDDGNALELFVQANPHNIHALHAYAHKLMDDREYEKAKQPLQQLRKLNPTDILPDNATLMLAVAHRELGDTEGERQLLRNYSGLDDDALPIYLRLLELETQNQDWPAVIRYAQQTLAVNPLIPQPWRALAEAAEKTNDNELAILAYQRILLMNPEDPAEVHYRLARLLHEKRDQRAKRHILNALEEAPRYRAAHALLFEINRSRQ